MTESVVERNEERKTPSPGRTATAGTTITAVVTGLYHHGRGTSGGRGRGAPRPPGMPGRHLLDPD